MKIFILFSLIYSLAFTAENFKETRYINAIDIEQYKYGNMNLDNDTLTLIYTKPNHETITYKNTKLIVANNDQSKEYPYTEYPNLQYMGLLLKAIVSNNYSSLDNLFVIESNNGIVNLLAKPIISNVIESIKIVKNKSNLEKFTLYMSNKDKITIETIN